MRNFSMTEKRNHELRLSCSYLEPEQIDEGVKRLARFVREQCLEAGGMPPTEKERSYA
jgi:(S)-3,5-dihydroxyphenylglycine transaminase